MSERAERLHVWLGVLCGIAAVTVVVSADPHVFGETARAARPFGAMALRGLVWLVIACAAYLALVRGAPVRRALASGRASTRGRR